MNYILLLTAIFIGFFICMLFFFGVGVGGLIMLDWISEKPSAKRVSVGIATLSFFVIMWQIVSCVVDKIL